ncbi:hypothetical protein ETAA8_60200 [Anatilimnocola aggregata]|uniref:Uncharacterized protein n=2 Tax=Anatilimnocola aggregata TaxID=2528021 RepID=A0A517YKW4_9BACT|nr:hypothetical protein ETAA8_60200 [Anatilimnocola aggregata]
MLELWPLPVLAIYFILSASLLGRWMLQPVNETAGRLQAPRKFMLTDFAWLVLQLQLALGFSVSWIGPEQRVFLPILGFLMFAVTMLWLFGVGFLSRANVTQPLRRAIFTTILLPATLGVMMALPALVLMLGILETDFTNWGDLAIPLHEYNRWKVLLWIVTPLLPVLAWLLRQISFWVVSAQADEKLKGEPTRLKPT